MQIQNEEATRIIREQAKLTLAEGFPQVLLPNVVPVMDMSPDFHRNLTSFTGGSSSTGSITAYTGKTGTSFCVIGIQYSMVKDVTCDIATTSLTVLGTQGGVSKTLCAVAVLTLTVQNQTVVVNLPRPIILDPGTNITSAATFTAGAMRRQVTVYGYEINTA